MNIPQIAMENKLKVETIIRITKPDGSVIEACGESDPIIPAPEDFDLETKEGFLRDFDSLEKGIITARKEAEEKLSSDFLADTSKKRSLKHRKPTSIESEVGRIPCLVYGRLASTLKPKERIASVSIQGLTLQ